MSKINVSAQQLLEFDAEIRMSSKSLIDLMYRQLLQSKLNTFYNKNGARIDSLKEKGSAIMAEYYVLENGVPVMEMTTTKSETGEDKQESLPKMQEGKLFEDAKKAMEAFHSQQVAIDI